jgi:hypothetical protein
MPGRLAARFAATPALMSRSPLILAALAGALLLAGCVTAPPTGPSVTVLPGTSKNFDQFRFDDSECRQYAYYQSGGATGEEAAVDSAVRSAAVGTIVGAAAGALIGGGRSGAAVGAGTGLIVGSSAGYSASNATWYELQRRYDSAYMQCMYSKGHQVPGVATSSARRQNGGNYSSPPPPPPGTPPPPPPR